MAGGAHTAEFIAALEPFLKPGDVINIDTDTMWYDLPRKAAYWCLRREQLDIYGLTMRWRDVHTMLYFGKNELFTMDSFQGGWFGLDVLEHANVSIYRYTKRALGDSELAIMRQAADALTGAPFIENQQLEAVAKLLGYKSTVKPCFFNMTRFAKPGAIGARACFEYLRKELERQEQEAIPRLFSKFRYDPFGRRDRVIDNNSELRGVDVEATSPAHFANTAEFDDEFELVAEFHHGQQRVPEPPPPSEPEPDAADAHGHHH